MAIFAHHMAFLHPGFLWALLALAIPIAIHLFQLRRYKRIAFSDVRFLEEVTLRTRARHKVRHWLTLLARMLALAALVMAFAQPYIPGDGGRVSAGQRDVSIYIDDSWSMDGENAQGRLLDQARTDALDAIGAFSATDRFQVITNRFEGRQQLLTGRDDAMTAVSQVDAGPYARPLGQVIERQREALSRGEAPVDRAFLFTDLQRSTTDVENWTEDTTVRTVIVPLIPGTPANLAIDSAWFASPVRRIGQQERLHVRIRNLGPQALENVPFKLSVDGRPRAMGTFAVEADATTDTVLHFTNDLAGPHHGTITITDRPITFDDALHIAYRTAGRSTVLLVSGGDERSDADIEAVFRGDSAYEAIKRPYRQLDLALLADADLVVLNALPDMPTGLVDALVTYCSNGGNAVVFPPANDAAGTNILLQRAGATLGATDTASTKVERMDLRQPFFRDVFNDLPRNVDLPTVKLRHALRVPPTAGTLLQLSNGTPFLADIPLGEGRLYACASPLSPVGGSFTAHALFVTSLLRMAELGRPMGPLYHVIGADAAIALQGVRLPGDAVPHLRGPGGIDLVPEVRRMLNTVTLALHDNDLVPGPYAVTLGADTITTIALDLPRTESDLSAFTPEELSERLEQRGITSITVLDKAGNDLAMGLRELEQGTKLWKWFVLLALLFLALETILIRTAR